MNILLWLIFGGIAGWIATLLTGIDAQIGTMGNIIIGIVGAVIGGWIGDSMKVGEGKPGADRPTSVAGFVWAVIGAVILLFILNLIF